MEASGIGPQFRAVLKTATEHGLYARPYKTSIMYTSPAHRTRWVAFWAQHQDATGKAGIEVSTQGFSQFYGVTEEQLASELGGVGWLRLEPGEVGSFTDGSTRGSSALSAMN